MHRWAQIYLVLGLPAVVNLAAMKDSVTLDKEPVAIPQALKQLSDAGADVVGINCFSGPDTIIPIMKEIKKVVAVSTHYYRNYYMFLFLFWHHVVSFEYHQ